MSGATSWPLYFTWNDGILTPLPRYLHRCAEQFEPGKIYRMVQEEERSERSHNHFFASLRDGYLNLPEDIARRFQNEEHLRKWCLIKCGWCNQQETVCDTPNDAKIIGAFIARYEPYAVVVIRANVIAVYTAKSQSERAMGKKDFQKSKTDVLGQIETMIGVASGTLMKQQESKTGDR